jgi:hypothetical protein
LVSLHYHEQHARQRVGVLAVGGGTSAAFDELALSAP